jgi:hypothetical protein
MPESQPVAPRRERAIEVLNVLMVEANEENVGQMEVFLEVFDIYVSRNRRHRSQWRVGGVGGLLVDLRKKVERLWNEFMLSPVPPTDEDSAIDAINYAAFFIRARREQDAGKQVGSWLWPTPFAPAEQ